MKSCKERKPKRMIEISDLTKEGEIKDGIIAIKAIATAPIVVDEPKVRGSIKFFVRPDYSNTMASYGLYLPIQAAYGTNQIKVLCGNLDVDAQFDPISYWPDQSIKSVLVTAKLKADKACVLQWGSNLSKPKGGMIRSFTYRTLNIDNGLYRIAINYGESELDLSIKDKDLNTIVDSMNMTQAINGYSKIPKTYDLVINRNGHNLLELALTFQEENALLRKDIIRIYRDSQHIDFSTTVIDDKAQKSNESFDMKNDHVVVSMKRLDFTLDLPVNFNRFLIGNENKDKTLSGMADDAIEVGQKQKGAIHLNKNGFFNTDADAKEDSENGIYPNLYDSFPHSKGKGYIAASTQDESKSIAILVRNYWQEWPKALYFERLTDIGSTMITASLFDGDSATIDKFSVDDDGFVQYPNQLYHQRHGMAKTFRYRVVLDPNFSDDHISKLHESYQDNTPIFNIDSATLASIGILDSKPTNHLSRNYDESLLENVLIHSEKKHPVRNNPTGWRHYGDKFRLGWDITEPFKMPGLYNGAHVGAINEAIQYLRTGDLRWWEYAVKETQHFIDIDVSHSKIYGRVKVDQYNPLPAGMVKSANHKEIDHDARNMHNGHMHTSGLLHYCQMTGDSRAIEVFHEMAGFWEHIAPYDYPLPRPKQHRNKDGFRRYTESEREHSWPLDFMNQYVMFTGNMDYHDNVSTRVIKFLIDWWKTDADHFQSGEKVGVLSADQGTGYWNPDDMDNGISGTISNGCQPWMAAPLFTAVIQWLTIDNQRDNSPNKDLYKTVRLMLYQCMQHNITHGYENGNFVYSEVRRTPDESGARMMISPLCRLYLIADSYRDAPSYIDLEAWRNIIEHHSKKIADHRYQNQNNGRYGYEFLYPGWFFKDIETIQKMKVDKVHDILTYMSIKLSVSSQNLPPESFLFNTDIQFDAGAWVKYSPNALMNGNKYPLNIDKFGRIEIQSLEKGTYTFRYTMAYEGDQWPDFKTVTVLVE
jgi:hypothetical protein